MTLFQSLLTFVPAATIMAMTPGVDTAMVLRSATIDGSRPASFAVVGIGLGCLIWGCLVSVGLGALLAASPIAFAVLKYAGAAYLLWLGLGLLLKPRATLDMGGGSVAPMSAMTALRRGLLTNLLNPKIAVMYLSLLPQFISPDHGSILGQSLVLGSVQIAISVTVNAAIAMTAGSIAVFLASRPRWVSIQRWIMATVLGGLAVRMATEARR